MYDNYPPGVTLSDINEAFGDQYYDYENSLCIKCIYGQYIEKNDKYKCKVTFNIFSHYDIPISKKDCDDYKNIDGKDSENILWISSL